ncbi:hypothetical protein [Actinocrispum wychmicini]|uniref:Uncharacterized protein n=1 Tax=Actinocrispum wychmicini TaxID=1213861 RepID=A0A4R2JWW4_9PSEU|nr:hypothetical protein [Actinocrispum wychmicini]TCO64973.1 hypothetical protein EV192_101757 [Actinocrispum wychmicini]
MSELEPTSESAEPTGSLSPQCSIDVDPQGHVKIKGRVADEVIRAYEAVHRAHQEGSGTDASREVTRDHRERKVLQQSPWVSGSFYLVLFVVVTAILLIGASLLALWALPIFVVGGLLSIAIVGAFQLRQDDKLSEQGFLRLMVTTVEKLPAALTPRATTSAADSSGGDDGGSSQPS